MDFSSRAPAALRRPLPALALLGALAVACGGPSMSAGDATPSDGRATDSALRDAAPSPDADLDASPAPDADPDAASPMDAAPDAPAPADAAPDAPAPPTHCGAPRACPATGTLHENGGLVRIEPCAFRLTDANTWSSAGAIVAQLATTMQPATVPQVFASANRTGTAAGASALPNVSRLQSAFEWQSGDLSVAYWIPQGITSTGDAVGGAGTVGGYRGLLVSWYFDDATAAVDKGVRVAFVDLAHPSTPAYRFALLVQPTNSGGRANYAPVNVHAGGLAWFGHYLYVVDTSHGFRVFDLDKILRVPGTTDTIGYDSATGTYSAANYAYVIPQVGAYSVTSPACAAVFSFVSVDRSTDPPSLLTGEYVTPGINGRVLRWPLDPATGRLAGEATGVYAMEAYVAQQSRVQGAFSDQGTYFLSCSSQNGSAGALYRTRPATASHSFGWSYGPEDLTYDPGTDLLWSLSEHAPDRYVFSVHLSDYR